MRQIWTFGSPLEHESFEWLDKVAEPLQKAFNSIFQAGNLGRTAKNWLNGVPLRHRMHPAFIIIPLGAWTTATLLDILDTLSPKEDSRGYRASADISVAFGLIGVLPAASAGIADWVDTYAHHRRVGMAHALFNISAVALYATSLGLRLAEQRTAARLSAGLGYVFVGLGSMLGGELVYNLGVNVPHLLYPKPPTKFVDVAASLDLPEDQPIVVEVERVPVLLLRRSNQIFAVEAWCPHAGGPLQEGEFEDDTVTCPWHGSRFCLADGKPLDGPATAPLRTFDVRERYGRIAVCPSYEGQEWPPAPAPPKRTH